MFYKLCLSLFLMAGWLVSFSQDAGRRDTTISRLVDQVSEDSLRAYIDVLVGFGTRHTLSTQADPRQGIGAARNWVLRRFREYAAASGGRMTAKTDTWLQPADQQRMNRAVEMGNVMATIAGTDPGDDRIFIVSAHLDSRNTHVMDSVGIAPGANDDGSGVAALLEMARLLSTYRAKATIVLVAVSGEEQGLLGSIHLARKAQEDHWHVAAVFNNDMIGQSTSSGTDDRDNTRIRVFSEGIPAAETPEEAALRRASSGDNDSKSRELARYVKAIGNRYVDNLNVELVYRQDRFLRGGDHIPFQQRGYTAVRLTDFYENYERQHQDVRREGGIQYGDLPQFVDFGYLRKTTGLNVATLASLANAPSVPQAVKMDVRELSNYTRLYWQKPQYGTAKGYYVLMRETSAPVWQKIFYTEKQEILLPYSRDNYFFAVQAVGEEGLPGMPLFPVAGR